MAARSAHDGATPTVLLVHGAFADSSCWAGAITAAADSGADVVAVANPLRGLAPDSAYVAALSAVVDGPVVLVGHSYGGAVITVAGAQAPNVVGLGYVAGFAPDESESCIDLSRATGDDRFLRALDPVNLALPDGPRTELHLDRSQFGPLFAGDLPAGAAAVAAASQRPVLAGALTDTPSSVGWRRLPCWFLVPTEDRVVDVATHRAMAARAGAVPVEVRASHAVVLSRPDEVADLIRAAVAGPPVRGGGDVPP